MKKKGGLEWAAERGACANREGICDIDESKWPVEGGRLAAGELDGQQRSRVSCVGV